MKIFLIENEFCHCDATRDIPDLNWARKYYPSHMCFVEAPDYVAEGWVFDEDKEGDARFVQPDIPDGWLYDEASGTYYREDA